MKPSVQDKLAALEEQRRILEKELLNERQKSTCKLIVNIYTIHSRTD